MNAAHCGKKLYEINSLLINILLCIPTLIYRSDNFRDTGEVLNLIPKDVNMQALTATATRSLRVSITSVLSMHDPIIIVLFAIRERTYGIQ